MVGALIGVVLLDIPLQPSTPIYPLPPQSSTSSTLPSTSSARSSADSTQFFVPPVNPSPVPRRLRTPTYPTLPHSHFSPHHFGARVAPCMLTSLRTSESGTLHLIPPLLLPHFAFLPMHTLCGLTEHRLRAPTEYTHGHSLNHTSKYRT